MSLNSDKRDHFTKVTSHEMFTINDQYNTNNNVLLLLIIIFYYNYCLLLFSDRRAGLLVYY